MRRVNRCNISISECPISNHVCEFAVDYNPGVEKYDLAGMCPSRRRGNED